MNNDFEIEIDNFINGVVIEQSDKEHFETERNKRLFAEAFIKVRQESGMNRKDFAEWLHIPYRTMQDWERGVSQVPEYVLRLVAYKVKMEKERGRL